MPRKGRSNEEIVHALHQVEGGEKVTEVCRRLGVSERTFYRWKKQFTGLGLQELRELRSLRRENLRASYTSHPGGVGADGRCAAWRSRGLVDSGACALFFPHGIGHTVGLGVRDAGGRLPGRTASTHPALRFLRIDLPPQEGHVVTIEPGIYFAEHILQDPHNRRIHRDGVHWDVVDRGRGFGGIRIEDDVLVGTVGPTILTSAIPIEE